MNTQDQEAAVRATLESYGRAIEQFPQAQRIQLLMAYKAKKGIDLATVENSVRDLASGQAKRLGWMAFFERFGGAVLAVCIVYATLSFGWGKHSLAKALSIASGWDSLLGIVLAGVPVFGALSLIVMMQRRAQVAEDLFMLDKLKLNVATRLLVSAATYRSSPYYDSLRVAVEAVLDKLALEVVTMEKALPADPEEYVYSKELEKAREEIKRAASVFEDLGIVDGTLDRHFMHAEAVWKKLAAAGLASLDYVI